jgi:hypothetical protein
MPPPTAPAPAAAGSQAESGMSVRILIYPGNRNANSQKPMIKSAVQGIAIFMAIQFFMGQFMGKKPETTTVTDASGAVRTVPASTGPIPPFEARPNSLDDGAVYNPLPQRIAPIWQLDSSSLDITIVVSPSFVSEPLKKVPAERRVVDEVAFKVGDYKDSRVIDTSFALPKEVQNNGTLWAHFYIGLTGSNLDPSTPGYDSSRAYHFIHPLSQYVAQKKIIKTKNLLAAVEDAEVCLASASRHSADRL